MIHSPSQQLGYCRSESRRCGVLARIWRIVHLKRTGDLMLSTTTAWDPYVFAIRLAFLFARATLMCSDVYCRAYIPGDKLWRSCGSLMEVLPFNRKKCRWDGDRIKELLTKQPSGRAIIIIHLFWETPGQLARSPLEVSSVSHTAHDLSLLIHNLTS